MPLKKINFKEEIEQKMNESKEFKKVYEDDACEWSIINHIFSKIIKEKNLSEEQIDSMIKNIKEKANIENFKVGDWFYLKWGNRKYQIGYITKVYDTEKVDVELILCGFEDIPKTKTECEKIRESNFEVNYTWGYSELEFHKIIC